MLTCFTVRRLRPSIQREMFLGEALLGNLKAEMSMLA